MGKVITFEDFKKIDIRLGKIVKVEDFPEAHLPLFKLKIDFGEEIGVKNSAAGFADLYKKKELKGKLVLGVVNLPLKMVGPFISEVLTLGVPDKKGRWILIVPEKKIAKIGGKLA